MRPYAYNVNKECRVDLQPLFGNDLGKLLYACERVYKNWLYPYEGCYRAEGRPSSVELHERIIVPKGSTFAREARKAIYQWYEEHPDEKAKEMASKKRWEAERDKQFRIIYGVAKRHRLHIDWYGNGSPSYGEQFGIYKNQKCIAIICCC